VAIEPLSQPLVCPLRNESSERLPNVPIMASACASTVISTTSRAPRLSSIESRVSAPIAAANQSQRRKPGQGLWIDPMVPQPQHGDSEGVGRSAWHRWCLRRGGVVPREPTVALP
jgi:hypothetical protein